MCKRVSFLAQILYFALVFLSSFLSLEAIGSFGHARALAGAVRTLAYSLHQNVFQLHESST